MVMKENMWRQRRLAVPKRTSELVALVALSSTLFLFLHTRDLHSRLREMEVRLQPGEGETLSGNQLSSEDGHSGHTGYTGPATNAPMLSQNMQKQTSVKLKSSEIDDKILDNNEDAGNIQMVGVDKSKRMLYFKSSWDEILQRLYASPPQTEIHTNAAVDSKPELYFLIFYPNKTVIILGNTVGRLAMALKITLAGTPHRFLIPAIIFLDNHRSSLDTIDKPLEESLDIDALNNTRRADKHVLFFNRVPKVGSQTFMQLLRLLSLRNGFSFNTDRVQRVETIRLSTYEQRQLVRLVNSYPEPSVYIKHVCFTNFTQFNLPRPIYMNVVRDPVERVISWYYYVRAPWYYVERKILFPELALPDPAWLKKDFETCVLAGDRECRYIEGESNESLGDHRRQTLFFCGHGEKCTPFNTVGALERAKLSVEKDYAVVGVLEDMNTTLAVLENYIPQFFRGTTKLYWDEVHFYKRINRNSFKPPVSEEVKAIVRQNFTREIEFYQFCKQRLHRQLRAIKLSNLAESDNFL